MAARAASVSLPSMIVRSPSRYDRTCHGQCASPGIRSVTRDVPHAAGLVVNMAADGLALHTVRGQIVKFGSRHVI